MTLQTPNPLTRLNVASSPRSVSWFHLLRSENIGSDPLKGGLELSPAYQRGDVWTRDQQRLLIKSFLIGAPVPAVVVNSRFSADFRTVDGTPDWRYAVVDGKQRVTAALAWFDAELDVPASWFDPDWVVSTVDTADGAYVTCACLTEAGRRLTANQMILPVVEATLPTLKQEAELYLLLNRGGVEHADADLEVARDLA